MVGAIGIVNGIIEILIALGVGIKTVKTLTTEFQDLFPEYEGIPDDALIDRYAIQNNLTREKLKAMLEE